MQTSSPALTAIGNFVFYESGLDEVKTTIVDYVEREIREQYSEDACGCVYTNFSLVASGKIDSRILRQLTAHNQKVLLSFSEGGELKLDIERNDRSRQFWRLNVAFPLAASDPETEIVELTITASVSANFYEYFDLQFKADGEYEDDQLFQALTWYKLKYS